MVYKPPPHAQHPPSSGRGGSGPASCGEWTDPVVWIGGSSVELYDAWCQDTNRRKYAEFVAKCSSEQERFNKAKEDYAAKSKLFQETILEEMRRTQRTTPPPVYGGGWSPLWWKPADAGVSPQPLASAGSGEACVSTYACTSKTSAAVQVLA